MSSKEVFTIDHERVVNSILALATEHRITKEELAMIYNDYLEIRLYRQYIPNANISKENSQKTIVKYVKWWKDGGVNKHRIDLVWTMWSWLYDVDTYENKNNATEIFQKLERRIKNFQLGIEKDF